MLRICIVLLGVSVVALMAASCAQTGAAVAGAETAEVTAAAATQVSEQVQDQANQIVTNVENGAAAAVQPVLPTNQGQTVLFVETTDAYIIVRNGVQTIVFKPMMWEKVEKMQRDRESRQ